MSEQPTQTDATEHLVAEQQTTALHDFTDIMTFLGKVRLNRAVLETTGAKNVFIFPAMGDEGLPVGACLHDLPRPIGGAVVDEDELEGDGGGEHRVDDRRQRPLLVEGGDEHGQEGGAVRHGTLVGHRAGSVRGDGRGRERAEAAAVATSPPAPRSPGSSTPSRVRRATREAPFTSVTDRPPALTFSPPPSCG